MEYLKTLSSRESIGNLKISEGIGDNIADCIAYCGLYRLEAFPINKWISRPIRHRYSGKLDIEDFPRCHGVVQQYMCYIKEVMKKGMTSDRSWCRTKVYLRVGRRILL
jgi:3-methyladenine DNA glycosylase/8-oxoguanine DNA glycosylase